MRWRILTLAVLAVLGSRAWWRAETEWPIGGPSVEIVVPQGASTQAISAKLQGAGLLKRPWTFVLLVRWRGDGTRMKAGRYRFEGPYSLLDIEQKMVQGEVERREVTFPEGRSLYDVAEIVARAGMTSENFRKAAEDTTLVKDLDPEARNLEGYLFPETYDIKEGSDEHALAAEMVARARTVFEELGLDASGRTTAGVTLTLRQIVTLASIVELETAAPEERPRIAGVFLNRLLKGMKLQTDPTVIYALKLEGQYHGNIRKVDLSSPSPYNTYRFTGLPPGPIASPGRGALEAVLSPEPTDALYFVSRNDGTHVFSKTLREHERAVDAFQRRRPETNGATSQPPTPLRQ
jgi:UPF0755 protein